MLHVPGDREGLASWTDEISSSIGTNFFLVIIIFYFYSFFIISSFEGAEALRALLGAGLEVRLCLASSLATTMLLTCIAYISECGVLARFNSPFPHTCRMSYRPPTHCHHQLMTFSPFREASTQCTFLLTPLHPTPWNWMPSFLTSFFLPPFFPPQHGLPCVPATTTTLQQCRSIYIRVYSSRGGGERQDKVSPKAEQQDPC